MLGELAAGVSAASFVSRHGKHRQRVRRPVPPRRGGRTQWVRECPLRTGDHRGERYTNGTILLPRVASLASSRRAHNGRPGTVALSALEMERQRLDGGLTCQLECRQVAVI